VRGEALLLLGFYAGRAFPRDSNKLVFTYRVFYSESVSHWIFGWECTVRASTVRGLLVCTVNAGVGCWNYTALNPESFRMARQCTAPIPPVIIRNAAGNSVHK
jgi:hypothetical protein